MVVELGDLGFDEGGHLLVKRALSRVEVGETISVRGTASELAVHLRAWSRAQGHRFTESGLVLERGSADVGRWRGAVSSGTATEVVDNAHACWGLAGRSATVEAGAPHFEFALHRREDVWAEGAGRLYAQAAAAQWDPNTAIDWSEPFSIPEEVEDAVVQVMTYLVENETAALIVPAKFTAKVHPHFREVMQLLAIQVADEARHIEVFTRRALLRRPTLALSTVGGQSSLKTLVDEPDFALASFLLSVLGEGSFLALLWFLHEHGPDPVTRRICQLAAQDEARHVAFGIAHLSYHAQNDPTLLDRLALAIERRHETLSHTAGLNEEVFDSLLLLAAGSWEPSALRNGHLRVAELKNEMDRGRRMRMTRIGFDAALAESLSALHTRNFM